MRKLLAYSLALLAGTLHAADTIYKSTDKHGNPVFTDQPQPAARPVELKPINTTPALAPSTQAQPTNQAFAGYQKIQLSVPSSIPNGLAPTTIGIALQPPLQPGHRWQLLLDNEPQAAGQETSATIAQIERGTHHLVLQIMDANGALIGSSADTEIFVYWPSKNR